MDDKVANALTYEVNAIVERVYGDEARLAETREVRVHALSHPLISTEGQITVIENEQMVRVGDKYMSIPTLRQGVVMLMALGFDNVRMTPQDVTVTHLIQVMRIAERMGMDFGHEELEDILKAKIESPGPATGPMAPPTD